MDDVRVRKVAVGNDFIMPTPVLSAAVGAATMSMPSISIPVSQIDSGEKLIPLLNTRKAESASFFRRCFELLHSHSLIVFSVLILAVGFAASEVVSRYYTVQEINTARTLSLAQKSVHITGGLNMAVKASQLTATLQSITAQPATLSLGTKTVPISPGVIKSWLQITPSTATGQDNLHTSAGLIDNSLLNLANQYTAAPVNQVNVTHTDNITPSGVIVNGQNGTTLSSAAKAGLLSQSQQIAKGLMGGKGFQVSAPLVSVPFLSLTPANFGKLLEVDVTTKRMYAYQNGQLIQTFLVSAGAPATPTPIGEFHIYEKLASQNMSGFNPNGTPYFQPNVPYVNYFLPGGFAVHGNYWRPASYFGNINSSHGCVGVQVAQAQWIYNWAPIGTTVITHA